MTTRPSLPTTGRCRKWAPVIVFTTRRAHPGNQPRSPDAYASAAGHEAGGTDMAIALLAMFAQMEWIYMLERAAGVPLAADTVPLAASRWTRPGRPGAGMAGWRVSRIAWHAMGTSPSAPGRQKPAGCRIATMWMGPGSSRWISRIFGTGLCCPSAACAAVLEFQCLDATGSRMARAGVARQRRWHARREAGCPSGGADGRQVTHHNLLC